MDTTILGLSRTLSGGKQVGRSSREAIVPLRGMHILGSYNTAFRRSPPAPGDDSILPIVAYACSTQQQIAGIRPRDANHAQ